MNCETVRDLIDSYVAGTLAAREAMALEHRVRQGARTGRQCDRLARVEPADGDRDIVPG